MSFPFFNAGASHTNDFAYEKTAFTYSLTNSIGSASAVASQQIGQVIVAKRTGTSGINADDWTGESNMVSTTYIPNCTNVTTSEIRAVVGGTNPIIFDSSVPH